MRNHSKICFPLYRAITAHSLRSKSRMCCFLYSLSKILFTNCMYIIVNKATFMVNDPIKAINKNNIKLINTTSLSDSKLSGKVATQLLISFLSATTIAYL